MADNYTVKNSAGTDITIRAKEVSAGQYSPRVIPQVADADIATGNPMPISDAGGSITVDAASLPLPTGAATAANQSSELTLVGAVTETAPANDTASSGLNGRLQRIAQRLSSLIGLFPTSVGQKTAAGSLAVVLPSDQGPVPSSCETGRVFDNGTAITPKFVSISASTSGNNTLIAAVSGKKIRVLAYTLVCTTSVTAKFQSGAGGTDLTGAMPFGANGGASAPFCPVGHFETGSNALLNLSLGSGVAVAGHITYIEV